jgi:methyl-accepting chemotaxis protein
VLIAEARTRSALRRLAIGLIVYGVVGLVVAAIGLAIVVSTAGRLGSLSAELPAEVDRLTGILDRTAVALDEAGATALSFSGTIDRTGPAVRQAATAVRGIVPELRDLERQAGAVSILGSQPLGGIASLFGDIAGELEGLDAQLDGIAEQLSANGGVLKTNATSLAALAGEVRTLSERLAPSGGTSSAGSSLGDAGQGLGIVLAVLIVLAAVPAAGAVAMGVWLRRLLDDPVRST